MGVKKEVEEEKNSNWYIGSQWVSGSCLSILYFHTYVLLYPALTYLKHVSRALLQRQFFTEKRFIWYHSVPGVYFGCFFKKKKYFALNWREYNDCCFADINIYTCCAVMVVYTNLDSAFVLLSLLYLSLYSVNIIINLVLKKLNTRITPIICVH